MRCRDKNIQIYELLNCENKISFTKVFIAHPLTVLKYALKNSNKWLSYSLFPFFVAAFLHSEAQSSWKMKNTWCPKKHIIMFSTIVALKSFYMITKIINYIYDTFYSFGCYIGFYSSIRVKIWANCGHFDLASEEEDKWIYSSIIMYVLNGVWKIDLQQNNLLNLS